MSYVHEFIINNEILIAKEDNLESGEISFKLQNNNHSLKIVDFHSGCMDPNYYQGTEMILYLLNHLDADINHIHGMLSTVDAKDEFKQICLVEKRAGWHVSIPFYASLTKYIPNSKFYLYDSISFYFKNDITDEYFSNPKGCINRLINRNQDCSFSIVVDTI